MTICERIFDELKKRGIDQKVLATYINENEKTLSSWKNNNTLIIAANRLSKISDFFEWSLDYLIIGKEKSFPSEPLSEEEQKILKYFKELSHNEQQQLIGMAIMLKEQINQQKYDKTNKEIDEPNIVYIYYNPDFHVSAGLGDELPDYQQWGKAKIPKTLESQRADFILTVDGDSMEPKFYSGNLVLVKQQPDIDDGRIGIFRLNGEGYIKKKQGNKLISLNKKYPEITIQSEDYKCFGLVLGTTEIIDYMALDQF